MKRKDEKFVANFAKKTVCLPKKKEEYLKKASIRVFSAFLEGNRLSRFDILFCAPRLRMKAKKSPKGAKNGKEFLRGLGKRV